MAAREERDRYGVLPRQPACHLCPHEHHILACDQCACEHDIAPGID